MLFALLASCAGSSAGGRSDEAIGVSGASLRPPIDFTFESLDDPPVGSQTTRGKPTVITFVTTSSLPAQAQVDFLVAMARHDGALVNYMVVALEGAEGREMVELYKKALDISFPVALADAQTLAGTSAFGDVGTVPVTILLDRAGRMVWRTDGRVVQSGELRARMRGL